MTDYATGKTCEKHPHLNGRRYARNRACPACTAERNKNPERMEYKRQYQRERREDPAVRELEALERAERRGPRKFYSAIEWAGAQARIRNLEAKLASLRARIASLEANR